MFCRCCFVLILLFTRSSAHNDIFTSISQMLDLLFMEKDLVSSLKDYIRAEEHKLEQIKKWAYRLDVLPPDATQDPEGFLGHPVNAFKLMKRLNTEWRELASLVLTDMPDAFISKLTNHRQNFPNNDDQTGAAKALMRLQDTYQLDTNTISTGELPGSSSVASLTVDDCNDLGKMAYSEADYYHAELWMAQALKQLDQGETPGLVDVVKVLEYLRSSAYQQGALERELNFTKRLLELDPSDQQILWDLEDIEYELSEQKKTEATEEAEGRKKKENRGRPDDYLLEKTKYEQLCRGEGILMTPSRQKHLFCRYYDNNRHPRYVIGPVRQEDEWDDPRIIRYHNIVSDKEMEKVKELAKPRLHRSKVASGKMVHYRISKSAAIGAYEDPVVDKINQRIEDITGLDVTTAEDLQVANYGIGGQYEPHYDFKLGDNPEELEETGNRIATWLLYISHVPAGGATVFPNVGAAVQPMKGTAVFWYNLLPSGKGDNRTRHAACPVLVGSKWVSNKWIHERGQEFRQRCGLKETD